jgi:amino acid transporter
MAFVSYIWLGALSVYALEALKPEFSLGKRIILAIAGIGITLFAVLLLVGVI